MTPRVVPRRSWAAKFPRVTTTRGATSSSWASSQGRQASISAGRGSRFPGCLLYTSLGVDPGFSDPPGDQLGVLGPEVDDEDGVGGQCPIPTPWDRWSCFPSVWRDGAIMTSAFWNSFTDW